jgi:hypothetical protein
MARNLLSEFNDAVIKEEQLAIVVAAHVLSKNEEGEFECPICYDTVQKAERVTISCRHDFCGRCTQELLKTCCIEQKNATCPMCRYPCFLLETPDVIQFQELSELLEEIQDERDREQDQEEMSSFLYYHFTHPQF